MLGTRNDACLPLVGLTLIITVFFFLSLFLFLGFPFR
jgi:hypothetical protein